MAGARWTGLIGAGLRTMLARRVALLSDQRHWAANSGRIQRAQLRSLLHRAQHTEFGREHGFAKALDAPHADLVRTYRERVPVREALDFRAMFARMREQAEPDIAWPGVVRDWAQTSGTTAGDKFIPVSREMMRHNYRCSLDIFAHAARGGLPLSRLFSGRILFLGGSSDLSTNEHGVRTGDLSGLVTPLIRWPLSEVYLPGPKIALMSDWPAKIDAMARRCLDEDVRGVSGMASWSLVLFHRVLELARERGDNARTLHDVWPDFELFIHGGVKYAPFEPRVREAWSGATDGPDVPLRVEVYPASEAFVATQDRPGRLGAEPGLRLNVDRDVYFEFVPVEEIGAPGARAFACDEVEKGQRYVVVLTTCAGLWRYVLGDVVEFDTIPPDGPARLRIVGRHKHFINAFGENLIVEHIENAVAAATTETGAAIGEFSAAPVYPDDGAGRRPGLELAVEWENSNNPDLLRRFTEAFDRSLKAQNVDYTTKRTGDLGMAPPVLTPLPIGAFHAWMASKGKLGGQHKCPRCANHRDILDEVVRIADRESGISSSGVGVSPERASDALRAAPGAPPSQFVSSTSQRPRNRKGSIHSMGMTPIVSRQAEQNGAAAARTHPAARAAIATLHQCERFLDSIDDDLYARPCDAVQGSTIGQHVRHSLDHVGAALCALAGDVIDYDHRDRDTPIERDRREAISSLRAMRERLGSVNDDDALRETRVRVMLDAEGTVETLRSTLGREIAFASHHALHHHAMIGAIASRLGVGVPEGFGRAPSTLHHERATNRD